MRKFLMLITILFLMFFVYSCTGTGDISITFEENGGTEVDDLTVSSSSTSINFPEPTREGFTFDGWYLDSDLTEPFTIAALLTNTTLTLYAKWTSSVTIYSITFEVNGGSAVTAITGEAGTTVLPPTDPIKSGFTFGGWYSDSALTTPYTFTTIPESNVIVYAKWNAVVVVSKTITFEVNGGSAIDPITQEVGSNVSAPVSPTKLGNTFDGWYSNTLLTEPYTFTTMPAEDITLYAKWVPNQYTIIFNENGGSDVTDITQAYLTNVTEPTPPTRLGYTFGGWYSDALLTTPYTFTIMPYLGLELFAKWTINSYTITFEENGGSEVSNISQDYMTAVTQPLNPTKEGYDFVAWYSNIELTTLYTFTSIPAEDITLYAKWEVNSYTITFEENGGTEVSNITQDYMTAVTQPLNPTKEGYDFVAWYTNIELTTLYTFTSMPAENITLYAKWVYEAYAIQYVDGDQIIAPTMIRAYDPIVLMSDPVRLGYIFEGWYNEELLINPFDLTVMPEEDITIYAKWSAALYTISYDTNGGSVVSNLQVPYNQMIPEHQIPIKDGYVFVGWYNDVSLTILFEEITMPLGDITLYAKWIVDDGYDMISTILAQNPTTVKVKGVVYYKFPNPLNPGFYLYDGTGFMFVLAPSSGLEVGDGIELEGDFGYFEYVPQITNVFNLVTNETFTTLPLDVSMSFEELLESSPESTNLFGQPIQISGVVMKNNGNFFLASAGSDSMIAINYKSIDPMNNPFDAKVGSMITMNAIIHGVDPMMDIWHILYNPTTPITDVSLTDQQKVDEIIQFGINQLDGREFYSTQMLELPSSEPVYGATLGFETIGDNSTYLNITTGEFLETDIQRNITIRITVTINAVTETVDVTIILLPTEILTIAEFMLLEEMDYGLVTGIVVFSFGDFSLFIIADENGDILPIQSTQIANYGDRVIVQGYNVLMQGLTIMYGADDTTIEVLEENVSNPLTPMMLTIEQFNSLDVSNSLYWAKYFTLSGELIHDEMTHSFLLDNGTSSIPIIAFNQEIYESLKQFAGFNVTLNGFSLPNFDEDPYLMFIFTGQPEDIHFDYTDQELADLLSLMLQEYLESETYIPGQVADLPTEHPIIDLLISYTVALDDATYIDLISMTIDSTIDVELWISLTATITIGEASSAIDIELHVKPLEILTVSEFMLLIDQDMHYVKGVILMMVPDQSMIMIADQTGALLSTSNNQMIQVGDLVLLYGSRMETPDGMVILANNPDYTVESILDTNQVNPLTPTPISLLDFSNLVIDDPQNYLNYYQVEGLLYKDLSENIFIISDGINQLPVFTPTIEGVNQLIPFEGQEVKLNGFSLGIEDGGGSMILVFIGYPGDVVTRYTDEELVIHIASELSNDYSTKILRPGAIHKLPNTYSPFEASISYEVIGANSGLYNLSTGFISDTITIDTYIGIRATVTAGLAVEVVEFDLLVQPIETQTIAEFYAGAYDELYVIRAIVVMEQMMDGPMIIADSTGHMFVVKSLGLSLGDEVIIQGYKRNQDGITLMWDEETTILVEVVSVGIPNPMILNSHTIVSFNDIDMTNMDNWGLYVEVSGYVSLLEDSYFPVLTEFIDGGEFVAIMPMYLFNNEPSLLVFDDPMESIYQYVGYEVTVRGFILPNMGEEDPYAPDRMMIITSPDELELIYQTDQEKIDALIEYGEYMLSNNIFRPGDEIKLPNYVDLLGISLTWEFVGSNTYAIDLVNMVFLEVAGTENLDFEATMTIGDLTVTHLFTLVLQPYPIITIEDFYNLPDGEYAKLHVIVIEKIEYYGVVFSELSSPLYLFGYGFDELNVGDEIILFGAKDFDFGFVSIRDYDDKTDYELLNTGVLLTLLEREVSLEVLATGSTESMNLLYYNVVQGNLVFNENTFDYYLTDGLNTILLLSFDESVNTLLDSYLGTDVELKFFNFQYHQTAYGNYWTGLVIDGTSILSPVTLTSDQVLDIMMNYMKNEMNRTFKDDMTYAFSTTHPIYGGSYQFVVDVLHQSLATVSGHEITFASTVEETYATIHITASYNSFEYTSTYDLIIVPYDDMMTTYNTGSSGSIPIIEDTTPLGTFGGLILKEVDRELDGFGGSNMIVDLEFPYPHDIGFSFYTLQYYDSVSGLWQDFMVEGHPLTTEWNNFSLILSEGMSFRLLTNTGLVSNAVSFEPTNIDTYFAGYYLEMDMFVSGVMSPFVGYGLDLVDIGIYKLDNTQVIGGYTLQWYRVNPYTYEEILIVGATNHLYVTTNDDIGYYTMVKVTGDEINVGGTMKIYVMETVKVKNYGYVSNETTIGFTIGFDYIVDINDLYDMEIYTQNGQLIHIDSITATADPSVFEIELNLIGVESIYIHLDQITYSLCSYNDYYEQVGIYVELLV